MNLPALRNPPSYRGLYVYDFGEWSAVGYTAEEIAVLLEDERTAGGKVFRIHSAHPDGTMELCAVSPERFGLEAGMFFYRAEEEGARRDFAELSRAADHCTPPARARLELADRGVEAGPTRFVVSLVYPAEYDADFSAWLLELEYLGGDTVEGGVSQVSSYLQQQHRVMERRQLWSRASGSSRTADEVRASVRRAVQR